jgi:hypothetical protein
MLLILRSDLCCFEGDLANISSLGLISATSVRLRPIVLRPLASFSKAVPRPPEGVFGLCCSSGDAVLMAVVGRMLKPPMDTPESVLDIAAVVDHAVRKLQIHLQLTYDGSPAVAVAFSHALVDDIRQNPRAVLVNRRYVFEEAVSLLLQDILGDLDGRRCRAERWV